MANTYRQVGHGEAGFDFANDSTTAIEAGTIVTVIPGVPIVVKDSVPGYNASGDNLKIWTGRGHLIHHDNAKVWEVYLDTALTAAVVLGQRVVLDGVDLGIAIPHPGPDAGNPDATNGAGGTPIGALGDLDPTTVVARSGDKVLRFLGAASPSAIVSNGTLTIDTDAVTVSGGGHYLLVGESDSADDLVTINGGVDGAVIVLQAAVDTVTITVKDGTGNIDAAADFALTSDSDTITLRYNAANTNWEQLASSDNAT